MRKKRKSAFHEMPHDARSHFILNLYGAIFNLIAYLLRLDDSEDDGLEKVFEQYPFLARYFEHIYPFLPEDITWGEAIDWWKQEIMHWEHAGQQQFPLNTLEQQLGISFSQRMAIISVGLVEEDSRFGTLFAELQAPLPHRRPGLEIIGRSLLADELDQRDPWIIFKSLFSAGLVETVNPDAPRAEWALKVPGVLWDALRGQHDPHPAPWAAYHDQNCFSDLDALILSPALHRQLLNLPDMISAGTVQVLILRGMEGSERLEVMGAIAKTLGRNVMLMSLQDTGKKDELSLAGALCAATGSIPVVDYQMNPGETVELKALGAYHGSMGVTLGFEGGLKGALLEKSITFRLEAPDIDQRRRHWENAFGDESAADLSDICERFHLPGQYIRKAGRMAIAYAGLEKAGKVTTGHVRQACRSLNHQLLDTLASPLEAGGTWHDLIVGDEVGYRLQDLETRCRFRERVVDQLGQAFKLQRNIGVRALFNGPSGTGKTLAARILAARLEMDIYRVDLAAVINKYIGETEKNLHRILARAEALDVILLLDEGDALLGKRTDVKSANDRYANLETNYLLQRLETYQGIILVTTNAGENIDSAFQRRMDTTVSFLPPEAEQRMQIWQLHLPPHHDVHHDLLLDVAHRCVMTGGQIKNAAQQATLFAMEHYHGVIQDRDLKTAIEHEYRKAGALFPLNCHPSDKYRGDNLEDFIDALSS